MSALRLTKSHTKLGKAKKNAGKKHNQGKIPKHLHYDYEKAFNRMKHAHCFEQLTRLGASLGSLSLVRSFLEDRKIGRLLWTDTKPHQYQQPGGVLRAVYWAAKCTAPPHKPLPPGWQGAATMQ